MTRLLGLLAIATVLLTPQLRASAQAVVSCPRAPSPPILDGNVTPDEWVASGRLGSFVLLNSGGLPMEATEVRVMYDDAALYVGAILHDSDTDKLKADVTEEDGDVYKDDCFEFFLNAAGAGPEYVHIAVNPAATRFDELGKDRTQNYRWTHGVTVHEDDWSVELAIPFGAGEPPAEGTTWAVGAARHVPRLAEYSTWSGCKGSFHEAENFGTVRFGGPHVSFKLVDIGARRLGANEAYLFVDNATADALEYKTNIRVLGRDRTGHFFRAGRFQAPPGARTPLDIPYEVIQDGAGSVMVSVTDETGTAVYRTAAFPIRTPEMAQGLFLAEAALAEANREWAAMPDSEGRTVLREELEVLHEQWLTLKALVKQREALSVPEQEEVAGAVRALEGRVRRVTLRIRSAAQAGGELRPFVMGAVNSLRKVFRDDLDVPFDREARIEACRNERESLQIVLLPLTDEPAQLTVSVTDLAGAGGSISREQISLRMVGYVPATDHLTSGAPEREWPDILAQPLGEGSPIELAPGAAQPLWLTIAVPPDAAPGEYVGEVRATAGETEAALPLTVTVHEAKLPDPEQFTLTVGFWQAPRRIAEQYGLELWSREHWELLRVYLQDLADHGQDLAFVTRDLFEWRRDDAGKLTFNYTLFDRYVSLCREVGIDEGIEYYSMYNAGGDSTVTWVEADGNTAGVTANPGDDAYDGPWSEFLTDFAAHLEENGWLQDVYICPADEPGDGSGVPTLARWARCAELVHAAHPKLKTTVALDSRASAETLAPSIDRMVFKLRDDVYSPDLAAAKRAEGGRAEAYICCHPDRPNTFITSPNIDSRVIGWQLYREGLQGLLRWSYERWPPDPVGQPEGDGRYAAGDLFIVYPGPEGPYATPRWEIMRDAFEDYELLRMLEEAVTQARDGGNAEAADKAQVVLDGAVGRVAGEGDSLVAFTEDPAELLQARAQVLGALDELLTDT